MKHPARAPRDNDPAGNEPGARLTRTVLDLAARIPASAEAAHAGPHGRAQALARTAAGKAAFAAGTLALPPGPLGWLTIAPELAVIWHIQRQLVADIAGAYGRHAELTRSHMLYCLFRHAAAQALRGLTAEVGTRLLIRDVPLRVLERIATGIGVTLSGRAVGRGVARWLPVAGTLGVAGYAWHDTRQVAATAMALFADEASTPRHARGFHVR
ncbi:MAG: hypothetical protein KF903_04090 [Dokdonella sp.]|uniref:hypothetical protein n=1 Tax=Dokdonella sp. TaxID=2291710 RepID=UPI0025C6C30A|nr:hypothetical protein [Dokdonella sp.]MBX3700161.1 hypothetical protein [Dokdonella sp.]